MTISTDILNNYKHIFANDPIIVHAVTTAADVPAAATLSQLVIRITANSHVHEIARQFIPGDTLDTDISSAFQAEYQLIDRQNEPSPNLASHTYTAFAASIQVYVRYLINGTEYNGWKDNNTWVPDMMYTVEDTVENPVYILRGGLSPYLRRTFVTSPSAAVAAMADNMTVKPALVEVEGNPRIFEIKNEGDTHLTSAYNPTTHVVTTTATQVVNGAAAGILAVENDDHRHQLVFRNSLGVLETFSVKNLQKKILVVESESYPIISNPSYTPNLNILTEAQNPQPSIEMSTGFIPKAWAEWFIREVLTATYVWMPVPILNPTTGATSLVKLPVHLESESVTLEEQTKTQLTEVKFDVTTPPIA